MPAHAGRVGLVVAESAKNYHLGGFGFGFWVWRPFAGTFGGMRLGGGGGFAMGGMVMAKMRCLVSLMMFLGMVLVVSAQIVVPTPPPPSTSTTPTVPTPPAAPTPPDAYAPAPGPDGASLFPPCEGVDVLYVTTFTKKIYPFLNDTPWIQPYRFQATATITNMGYSTVKSWAMGIKYQHHEVRIITALTKG